MQSELKFTAYGIPQPKGSAKAFLPFHATKAVVKAVLENWRPGIIVGMIKKLRPIVMSDNPKVKAWQKIIAQYASLDFQGPPWEGPVRLDIKFYLPRPKAAANRCWHLTRPDLDKLVRAVTDGLTGIVYEDDKQVVWGHRSKEYEERGGPGPRAVIRVARLETQQMDMDFKRRATAIR